MKLVYVLVLSVFVFAAHTGAAECQRGWTAYKDEFCLKTFDSYVTYEEAKIICAAEGDEQSKSSLVLVKDAQMQNLLVDLSQDIFDNLWLGGRYDEENAEFRWEDGEPLTYTNWLEGSPRNDSDSNTCIELRPINAKLSEDTQGKWADVNCQKRNLVMCQKVLSWSLQDAVGEIMKLRKRVETSEENLRATQENLDRVNSRVVPVGSIYIEYSGQPSPPDLWPDLEWEDISSTYAGLFFRAVGGGSAAFGTNQSECAPRVSEMQYGARHMQFGKYAMDINIPPSGWSEFCWAGEVHTEGDVYYEGLRVNTQACEIRPNNQAVRIWRRTA